MRGTGPSPHRVSVNSRSNAAIQHLASSLKVSSHFVSRLLFSILQEVRRIEDARNTRVELATKPVHADTPSI